MRLKFYFLILFLYVIGGVTQIKAQSIIIKTNDGGESTSLISAVHKFTFVDNQLLLSYDDGTSTVFDLSLVDKMYFEDVKTEVNESLLSDGTALLLYPNPVTEMLQFKNLPVDNSIVNIFSIDGKIVMQAQISSDDQTLDVSNLSAGLYIIQLNSQTLKFIKQ